MLFRYHSMRAAVIRQTMRYQWGGNCRSFVAMTFVEPTGRIQEHFRFTFQTAPTNALVLRRLPKPSLTRASFSTLSGVELNLRLSTFQDSFAVARDCIEELVDTQPDDEYYDDNLAFAKDAVESAIEEFNDILEEVEESEKQRILRGHGLKVKQLVGELELAMKGGYEDDTDK